MIRKSSRLFFLITLLALFSVSNPLPLSARLNALAIFNAAVHQSSTGPAPAIPGSTTPPHTEISFSTEPMSPLASTGKAAFALELHPDERVRYIPDANTPDEWIYAGNIEGRPYYAGDFVGRDYSRLYVLDYNLDELHMIDTSTGVTSTIGACNPLSGHKWTGATGTASGVLYASSTNDTISYLYTVSISTGIVTPVGEITNAPEIIDIAINAQGEMYGVDLAGDNLIRINPATGAGTVIGPIGFDANYAQGIDFEEQSGVLYLAAFDGSSLQGELRIANTSTGSTTLVGAFPNDAEVTVLAFTPPPAQRLQNPGFESGWAHWYAQDGPILSGTSHSGSWSVMLSGQECWVYQPVTIPADALEITLSYWVTGISSDDDWDNDIICGSIWDLTWQTEYVDVCFGMTYFYSYPNRWRHRMHRLEAAELASIAGKTVQVAFYLTQDWNPGYHDTSTAYVDDTALDVTRPIYDFAVYLPMSVR
jgi:hypothetical protein